MTHSPNIELNPDGTFPHSKPRYESFTTTTTTYTGDFKPTPKKKLTWKAVREDLLGFAVMYFLAVGVVQTLCWLINGLIKLIKWL